MAGHSDTIRDDGYDAFDRLFQTCERGENQFHEIQLPAIHIIRMNVRRAAVSFSVMQSERMKVRFHAASDISTGPTTGNLRMGGGTCAGKPTDNNIIYAGNTVGATNISQFASHIHFRRYWVHGDWTTLTAGSNSMTNGFNLSGCYYCSVVGSQVSQALRPGAEGHAILGQGLTIKIDNVWLEGQSSGVFSGGFSTPPTITGFVPLQDVQIGRIRRRSLTHGSANHRFQERIRANGPARALCGRTARS